MKPLALILVATTALADPALADPALADPASLESGGKSAGFFNDVASLPDGRVVVVAEATREPRSIGSYSVRLYGARNPEFPFDDFIAGAIRTRDGTLHSLTFKDVNDDGHADLIVSVVSAGSGAYLSADAFSFSSTSINHLAHVEGLMPGTDIIAALKVAGTTD